MQQYPIWNIIRSCIYKGAKSYGVKDRGDVEVRIGTSSNNSHTFLRHKTTHKKLDNGDREYHFYLDDVLVKRALLPKGSKTAYQLPLALSTETLFETDRLPKVKNPQKRTLAQQRARKAKRKRVDLSVLPVLKEGY